MKMMKFKRYAGYLAQIEIWLVAFFILISMAWPRFLPAAVSIAAFFWAVRWLAYRRISVRTPVDWPVILLGVMILVTLYATVLPEITYPQAFRLLSGIALFYAIANWANTARRLEWMVLGASLTGLALALSAPFSVQWVVGKIPFFSHALYERFAVRVSDAIHPNVLAGSLIILLPLGIGWLLFGWYALRWPMRIGLSASILAMLAVLILSESRGAWIAIAVGLVVMVMLRWWWGWVLVLLAGLMAALGVYRLGIATFLDLLASGATSGGLAGRLEIWSRAILMIQDFPFTGIGLGSFGKIADTIYPFYLFTQGSIPHAHNLFLQVAVDLGMPGLLAWMAILFVIIAAAWKVFRLGKRTDSGWMAGLGAGLLGSQVALIIHGFTDAVTWGMVRPAPLVWGIWGITVAALLVLHPKPLSQMS
jgi:putative inorganic carbon (hco3(-)) transporter